MKNSYDDGQVIFLLLALALIGFLVIVSKSKSKHGNLKPKSEHLDDSNKYNI